MCALKSERCKPGRDGRCFPLGCWISSIQSLLLCAMASNPTGVVSIPSLLPCAVAQLGVWICDLTWMCAGSFPWVQRSPPPCLSPFLPTWVVFNPNHSRESSSSCVAWMAGVTRQAEPHHWQSISRQPSQVSASCRKCFQSCRENLRYHFVVSQQKVTLPLASKARWGKSLLCWAPQHFPEQGLRKDQAKCVRMRYPHTVILVSYPIALS